MKWAHLTSNRGIIGPFFPSHLGSSSAPGHHIGAGLGAGWAVGPKSFPHRLLTGLVQRDSMSRQARYSAVFGGHGQMRRAQNVCRGEARSRAAGQADARSGHVVAQDICRTCGARLRHRWRQAVCRERRADDARVRGQQRNGRRGLPIPGSIERLVRSRDVGIDRR